MTNLRLIAIVRAQLKVLQNSGGEFLPSLILARTPGSSEARSSTDTRFVGSKEINLGKKSYL
jgi:hypothetical protein